MQISALREYVAFAKYLNFSTAAKKLYLSQPALSNHIANIEKELGVELVYRSQTLELTAAGKAFFEGCCAVIDSYDATLVRTQSIGASDQQGLLTIKMAFDGGGGSVRLAELIGDFKRSNPAIRVKLLKDTRTSVIDDLISGAIGCALLFNFSPESECAHDARLDCIVIDRAPITLVANKNHPLILQSSLTIEDVAGFPYAMPAGAAFTECDLSVRQIYEDHGISLGQVHYKMVDSLADLAASGVNDEEVLFMGPTPALPKNMAYRDFEPAVLQNFCIAFRDDNKDATLLSFLDFVRSALLQPTSPLVGQRDNDLQPS